MNHVNLDEPELRFPAFSDNWCKKRMKDICVVSQGLQIPISERFTENGENRYFYITNEFLKENAEKEYYIENPPKSVICTENDVLMTRTGNTGKVVTNVNGVFHNNFFKIDYDDSIIDKDFLCYFLNNFNTQKMIMRLAGTSTIPDLNHKDFYSIKITFPSLTEQKKIANFLSIIDKKIELLENKCNLLNEHKKGFIQKLRKGEIQFQNQGKDYCKWEETTLKDVLYEHKLKSTGKEEVYSVSVHKGIVNQIEHLGRSFATDSLSSYKLVKPGDIVYTKSPTAGFELGIIKQNKNDKNVLVSPLYGVFSPKTIYLGNYIDAYFESSINTRNYLHPIVQKGAKNTMNITNKVFLSRSLLLPTDYDEQKKISDYIDLLNKKYDETFSQCENMKNFKKGLLQKMFV